MFNKHKHPQIKIYTYIYLEPEEYNYHRDRILKRIDSNPNYIKFVYEGLTQYRTDRNGYRKGVQFELMYKPGKHQDEIYFRIQFFKFPIPKR